MPTPFPLVDVAVVLITDAERTKLLVDFNANWAEFSFPMTKLDHLPGDTPEAPPVRETPVQAAVRAAVEVLGAPLPPTGRPVPLDFHVPPYQRSGSDGVWKRYSYHLFKLTAAAAPQPLPGHVALWLSRAELETHEPVSPTVGLILRAVPPAALGV